MSRDVLAAIALSFSLVAAVAGAAVAQGPPPGPPPGGPAPVLAGPHAGPHDPIAEGLFPPELIMRHAGAIGLSAEQRAAIQKAILEAQAVFLDKQWTMQEETETLARLLRPPAVDEGAALAQADRLMEIERTVKRAQLALLVRIKNLLGEEQQRRLEELRRRP
jgi:Spy/CpxP family protein refolding chaperone